MSVNTDDLRIDSITELLEPDALIREIPPSEECLLRIGYPHRDDASRSAVSGAVCESIRSAVSAGVFSG